MPISVRAGVKRAAGIEKALDSVAVVHDTACERRGKKVRAGLPTPWLAARLVGAAAPS